MTSSTTDSTHPGIDLSALSHWLTDRHPELGSISGARRLTGGHSNLSFILETEMGRYVLRRPPLGHVMQTAHDMLREYRVQQALGPTAVPVPTMHFHVPADQADNPIGSEFYVMDFVPGTAFGDKSVNAAVTTAGAHALALETGTVLADLHSIDPETVGLSDFGRRGGFLTRQAKRWNKQLVASKSRDLPNTERLGSLLLDSAPEDHSFGIIHGDYKLNNTLVNTSGEVPKIVALLDWEMSTLGDPLTDLAVLGVYWRMADIHPTTAEVFASPVDRGSGYAEFDEVAEAYFARIGANPPDNLPWYHALAAFKIAVIVESLHYRYVSGQAVGDDFERIGEMTEPLAAEGLRRFAEINGTSGANR